MPYLSIANAARRLRLVSVLTTCCAVALIWCSPAPCAAEVVALRELERRALDSRALADTHAARVGGARAETRKAASAYYPQIGLKAEATIQPGRRLITVTDVDNNEFVVQATPPVGENDAFSGQIRYGGDINATANLYDFGRTAAAVAAGRAGYRQVVAEGEAERAGVVNAVRGSYLAWLTAHQLLQISEQSLEDVARRLARATALVTQGARPEGELVPVRSEELLTKLERERASNELARAKLNLERAVGSALPADALPDLTLLSSEAKPPAQHAVDPSLRLLERQYAATRALADAQAAARRPVIATAVSAGVRVQDGLVFPLYGAGLSFSVPLWDGGLTVATAAATRARGSALKAQMLTLEREHKADGEQAGRDVQSALERLALAKQLTELSQQGLATTEAGYELGATTFEQIAQARATLRRAQTEELLARVAHAEASLMMAPADASATR